FPGERYARSFHFENPNTCVTCHMFKTPAEGEEGHNRVGGHTFNVRSPEEFTGVQHGREAGEKVANMAACQQCHPGLQQLNRRARGDYDGDGRVEGVQDEVRDLLALVKSAPGYSATIKRTSTLEQAAARWNVAFVEQEGSTGIHNTAYAVTLLQRSYKKLAGNELPGADILSKRDDFTAKRGVLRLK
ncbi:MAG: ammonia-forming cytochrome c nitrite reductase subunit c552, partial [Candidatus Tectomicrobia bacterium]|nr:ammonia-forming cytochrome c nitrite reductase subunit c552 [Candidatus Tectomicrobia bacterium]